jgi:hypothetical protein
MELLVNQLTSELLLFLHQTRKVPNLRESSRRLVSPKVVVDLPCKHIVTEAKLSHLLQEVLNFDEGELFK